MTRAFQKRRTNPASFGSGVYPKLAEEQVSQEALLRIEALVADEEELRRVFLAIRQRGFVPVAYRLTFGPYPHSVVVALPAAAYESFVQELSLHARILVRG